MENYTIKQDENLQELEGYKNEKRNRQYESNFILYCNPPKGVEILL
jgi:hypothetical protein